MDTMDVPRPMPGADPLRRLEGRFLRPHRGAMAAALAALLAQSLLMLPVPVLQGRVLDRIAAPGARRTILLAMAAMLACYASRAVLGWAAARRMSRLSLEVVRDLTDAMHRKLQRLPLSYHDRRETGRLMSRITSDVGSLLIFLNAGSLQLAADLVLAAGVAAVLLWLRWRLALVALAVAPLYIWNHRHHSSRVHALTRTVRARLAAIYALLSERISAVRVVRSFAREAAEVAELDARLDAHRDASWAGLKAGASQGALATAIGGLGTIGVVALGAALVARGTMTVGELLAFYGLVGQLHGPIARLAGAQGMLAATRVAVERIVEVLDEPEGLADHPGARPIREPAGALAFRGVRFAHDPHGRPALDGVDLEVAPATTLGLFGPSGAGKSTLLALATRLYDLDDGGGAVLLDEVDVRDSRLADLRRNVLLVPQQATLFGGTIRSNLLYAAPDATEAAIGRALEAADLAATVAALPLGLDTPVGDRGLTLSGGQRQRLALARALVADPPVLLLDDCTSALDAETEARVHRALATLRAGRTTVVVSHKPATLRHADRVAVLDRGRVVAQGTPAEVLGRPMVFSTHHPILELPGPPVVPAIGVR
ncbi:MAG TPA: ABC transporter ATP-binding protein [Isosphaeraceae bacterium]|jgi:ABC-type multidrug transport system fused ATPase/permease subunit|nr:ABC transporter ATP-binding protein [Isosphaeraceae bacterium]